MTSDAKNGYCQQVADERKTVNQESIRDLCTCGAGTSIHSKACPYVAEWHRQDAAKREAEAFRDYQRIMAEQAKAMMATRDAVTAQSLATCAGPYQMDASATRSTTRTFTREEVLTVIKAQMAHLPEVSAERPALRQLMRTFKRME